ncbi:phosphoinositide 5-phosphatase INP54 KNAG_0K01090 [Huiozyma naganishii CBS 8797]|uniref:Inositol polyphosphate-related phosphatase domain-containing protein n=1 Tax=Huiozyma naganishii (strain ATCC MYA-139 / BCRC 22969 / CBS 8797 / KCTC 17520 / NBRC 10181 / NCYC 3082 / Yp74L-3) TaxID=1071383 RepID=J7SA75_HUIN7|nr:hypothetical protein KNAG_0K01090 [Kazachstania naganishii CBS 8797]CCK72474.1 hypothetical protein KNAG_0K01090 [Kazachstania naganishii CBS 8797]
MRVSVTSFNAGKLFPWGASESQMDAVVGQLVPQGTPVDVFALGFQELALIWEGSFPQLIQEYVDTVQQSVLRVLDRLYPNQYKSVADHHVGCIALLVFARNDAPDVELTFKSSCLRGLGGSSLKGAAAIRLALADGQSLSLICCHFNANEGEANLQRRVEDYNAVWAQCQEDLQLVRCPSPHAIFFGDLNFRVRGVDWNQATTLDYNTLLSKNDELNLLRVRRGVIFQQFTEPAISFKQTYKYNLHNPQNTYNGKRIPSWCDRILHGQYIDPPQDVVYRALPRTDTLLFTDHQPVSLTMTLPTVEQAGPRPSEHTSPITEQTNVADLAIGYAGWSYAKRVHVYLIVFIVVFSFFML